LSRHKEGRRHQTPPLLTGHFVFPHLTSLTLVNLDLDATFTLDAPVLTELYLTNVGGEKKVEERLLRSLPTVNKHRVSESKWATFSFSH
jgi:hypothetical protein